MSVTSESGKGSKMSNKLKPCPFCGEEAYSKADRYYTWAVVCSNVRCPGHWIGGIYVIEDEAIAAWNRRASDAD